jgi:uncharacterized RDD family membrane protein YckC
VTIVSEPKGETIPGKQIAGLPLAPFEKRIKAALWDMLFFMFGLAAAAMISVAAVITGVLILGVSVGEVTEDTVYPDAALIVPFGLAILILALAPFIYYVQVPADYSGTPGMRLVGLRAVNLDGEPMNWKQAATRALAMLVSIAALCAGALWMFNEPNRRTWQDLVAGTFVIEDVYIPKRLNLDQWDAFEEEEDDSPSSTYP